MIQPHKYRDYSDDQLTELYSNYLFDSWSYSKLSSFARNEKGFEASYIYNLPYKRSASEAAGSSYHKALQHFFTELRTGNYIDIVALQTIAYEYISEIWANSWKTQKTTPTIEECQLKATKIVNALLKNFYTDLEVYTSEIKEVIGVELSLNEFVTINGVDIPLPCHAKLDLVVQTKDGKIVIIDHKSKTSFTDEKEIKFSIGKQAITYVKIYEATHEVTVDEVWFVENKIAENKDKSPQLICFKQEMNEDTRALYEAELYEPLRRMLGAISDPDYVYLINDSDNYVDKAELYDFWALTMISEVDDFNIPESKRELMAKRLKKIRDARIAGINPKVIKSFREFAAEFIQYDLSNKDTTREQKIEHTLRTLGLIVNVAHTFQGYSSDTFLINVSVGTNLSTVFRYKLDIASALDVPSIRMQRELFVHEGKSYLAIEAAKKRETFLPFDGKYSKGEIIPLGVDNFGNTIVWDMNNPSTPHVLICGSTGSGKSVCLISIIEYAKLAGIRNIVIFDPKFEFMEYKSSGIQVYNDIEQIELIMEQLVVQMNDNIKNNITSKTLVIFDEFADAVANSKSGKDLNVYENVVTGVYKNGMPKIQREVVEVKKSLEENLRLLLQKGRSSGFRIIAATQRASIKVITGDAKVNFGVKISFRMGKEIDSKVVLDEAGAESLAGKGDGLISSPEYSGLVRFQSFYKTIK